jgi:BirA family biotin operon repressor/biotin-[acetyl-CoA-carboxylase] ligase
MPPPGEGAVFGPDLAGAGAGTRFADVRAVARTGSTNADVLALARAGAPEGVVVVADHQSAGRGRRDRRWEAPPGSSLLLSVLTRPGGSGIGLADDQLHLVPTAVGVAAAEASRAVTGADVRLKWPNDLVAGGRKLSGILAETVVEGGQVVALVVGIGVNVSWAPDGATSLAELAGGEVDRAALLRPLLVGLDAWYGRLAAAPGASMLLMRYRQLLATIGRRVRVETDDGVIVGDAVDVDGEGRLLVVDECPDRPRAVSVGDVVHLRSDPR